MLALLGGASAALAFAVSTLASTRASRLIGAFPTTGWVTLVGFPIAVAAALFDSRGVSADALPWLVTAGFGNVIGLLLAYTALRIGQVSVVAPIVSAEGAIAALLSVVAGKPLSAGLLAALALIMVGGAVTAASSTDAQAEGSGSPRAADATLRSVALAVTAAACFGMSLYATARIGSTLPVAWAMLAPRVTGVAIVAAPLALRGTLVLSRRALPFVVTAGLAEVVGFLSVGIGARAGIAVTSVLASQFAAVAVIGAVVVFGERLGRSQGLGIAGIAVGTALVALLSS